MSDTPIDKPTKKPETYFNSDGFFLDLNDGVFQSILVSDVV